MISARRPVGKPVEHDGELFALGRIAALDVDEETPIRKGRQHLRQRRHHADAAAAERKGLAAIGGVAIADVELPHLLHRMLASDTVAVGAAVERPVVKDGELPVRRRVHVNLDDIGAGRKARLHRGDGIFEIIMFRRQHAARRAGVILQIGLVEALGDAAMGEQHRLTRTVLRQKAGIVEVDPGRGERDCAGAIEKPPAHVALPDCIEEGDS